MAKRELRNSFGWRDVRVELTGGTLRVWLDGAEAPFLAVTDEKPIEGKGHIGIRAWGGAVRTDELKLHLAKRTLLIDEINPAKSTAGEADCTGAARLGQAPCPAGSLLRYVQHQRICLCRLTRRPHGLAPLTGFSN